MMSRLEWLVLATALLLLPGFSWGADPEPSLFDRLDKNQDGFVTREEARDATEKFIAKYARKPGTQPKGRKAPARKAAAKA